MLPIYANLQSAAASRARKRCGQPERKEKRRRKKPTKMAKKNDEKHQES
jgi:hypothetical protein